jgi:ATP-binding protein involved in chromosome partitioning
MSVGFLLGERQGLTLGAPLLGAALRQLATQVEWRALDVLLVDLPPGTADLQQQLVGVVALAGAIVVVGPQDVTHLDARKFVHFLRGADVRVLGGVENMSGLLCPHCGEGIEVFPAGPAERSIWSDGLPLLGRIPLDPDLTNQQQEFDRIAEQLADVLEHPAAA